MDAALVGIPVERLGRLGSHDIMRFEVVEPIKGSIGEHAVLLVDGVDADEYGDATLTVEGARFEKEAGLQIYDSSYPRVAEACVGTNPEYVRAAAQELPQPDGSVEVQAISIRGDLGTTHRLFGEFGHVAAYVGGEENLYHARFCSDGVTLAESYRSDNGAFVKWRDMRTLEVVAEAAVPDTNLYGAAIIVSCVQGNRVLVRTSDPFIVLDPDGTVVVDADQVFFGQVTDIGISEDGRSVAAIIDREQLQVASVDEPLRVARQLDVDGKVLSNVAVSPNGERIAFLRGRDKMRMVIVDVEGVEQDVIVDPGYAGAEVINWVEEDFIATGGWSITQTSLARDTPFVTVFALETLVDQELGYFDPPTGRTTVVTDDGPAVVDLRTGELVSLDGMRPAGIVLTAPEPLVLETTGFIPPTVEFPLPGGRVPATLDELVEVLRQNPDRFPDLAALDRLVSGDQSAADLTESTEPGSGDDGDPQGAATEGDTLSWRWVVAAAGLAVVASLVVQTRRRANRIEDSHISR
ncbi:MAG: hypothetical protein R8J94_06995 [Acidimicrobiia bacterium]|nr:hypothetical protein [Acidimicrobiia bacterium]